MLPNELDMLKEMDELNGFPLGLTSANTTKDTTNEPLIVGLRTRKKCTKQEPPPKRRRLIKRVTIGKPRQRPDGNTLVATQKRQLGITDQSTLIRSKNV